MKRIIILALAILLALYPVAVYALTAPSSMVVESVRAFRNIVVSGDMAVIFHARIVYPGSYPDIPASKSILVRLYADNGTLLGTFSPYNLSLFGTNGYGDMIGSFYFEDAPSWEEAFVINILGLPAYFDPIQNQNYTMSTSDYSSAVDTENSRADFYLYVMELCNDLALVYPDVALKATTDYGDVLSDYGEAYFRNVVPGIQEMCPQLFFVQSYIPETIPTVSTNMSLQTQYSGRLQGTDIMRGASRLGTKLGGIPGSFVLGLFVLGACIGTGVWTQRKGWPIEIAVFAWVAIVLCAALLIGDWAFTLAMIIGLGSAIGIIYIILLKRA